MNMDKLEYRLNLLSWLNLIGVAFFDETFTKIRKKLREEEEEFFPKENLFFRALELCSVSQTKVVILGQDPYPQPYAHGLAFSVCSDRTEIKKLPGSLINIYEELKRDLRIEPAIHGNLESWAEQGVLLLNSLLSVRVNSKESGSHSGVGWEYLTDEIIKKLSESKENLVFMLWGKDYASKKEKLIADNRNHLILTASHPSPISVNGKYDTFKDCKHFSKANKFLKEKGLGEINWASVV